MNFDELQKKVREHIYLEDEGLTRIALASIIATRLKLGDPVWLLLIGPSSSGKSQVLRPLALTDRKFIHRVDDLTENTFLSGAKVKQGEKEISLLKKIGSMGIIVVSDFTVIFSKSSESRAAILGQLRMVYDGEMTKYSGTKAEPIHWAGYLGILAGSTPSIYTHFEEVADMGERFIYYRMKPYDEEKATRVSLKRKLIGKDLDDALSDLYARYIKEAVKGTGGMEVPPISDEVYERIVSIALFAAKLRTPTHYDRYAREIDKIPISEMPMRVALQLGAVARGLMVMHKSDTGVWDLGEEDIRHIEWCAYSLANEERRACLRILCGLEWLDSMRSQTIADTIGLATSVTTLNLQHLAAIGVVERRGDGSSLTWRIRDLGAWEIVRRLEKIEGVREKIEERELAAEEASESDKAAEEALKAF